MYKTSVRGAGTNESRREGDDCLYHTPESGCGDKHTVIRREASGQPCALPFHPVGHLPADFLSLLFKRLSRFLAECDRACPTQGRNSPVHFGQGFRKSVFELFHVGTKNADSFIIVFQRIDYAVLLLHFFGSRKCPVYFREIEFFIHRLLSFSSCLRFLSDYPCRFTGAPACPFPFVLVLASSPRQVVGTAATTSRRNRRSIEHPDEKCRSHVREVTAVGCLPVVKFIVEHVQPRFRATRSAARCARMWMSWSLLIQPFLSIRQYAP